MTGEVQRPKRYQEHPLERQRARELRRQQTQGEHELWMRLRWRQVGGHKFRRQYPVQPFYADFCCLEARLIVEVDGGQHYSDPGADRERTQILNKLGFRVVRFSDSDVLIHTESVLEVILHELQKSPATLSHEPR